MVPCKVHHYHLGVCCHCQKALLALAGRATTQKARSVAALEAKLPVGEKIPTPAILLTSAADVSKIGELPHAMFARPCPPTPRPGFVESRPCATEKEIAAVMAEVFEAEPEGEVLLMPPIDAAWNYIVTPGQFVIGPGNAGATAGKASRAFPINHEVDSLYQPIVDACVKKGEAPHFELVVGKGKKPEGIAGACGNPSCESCYPKGNQTRYWTQCRSGPEVSGVKDFVPAATVVAAVITPCDDLIEWEAICKKGLPPDTVVNGVGHSLASHAALHSIANGIPFITSHKPLQGEALQPEVPKWSLSSFAEGVGYGKQLAKQGDRLDILLVLYGLHHAPALVGDATFYIGLASAIMFRWGLAAGEVELNGDHANSMPKTTWNYQEVLGEPQNFLKHRAHLPEMIEGFFQDDHEMGWGGRHWGRCVYALYRLDAAILQALHAWRDGRDVDTIATIGAVVTALNKAVDQVHNGGYWMNKYASSSGDFQMASDGRWALLFQLAERLYALPEARQAGLAASLAAADVWEAAERLPFPRMRITASVAGDVLTWQWKFTSKPPHIVKLCQAPKGPGPVQVSHQLNGPQLTIQFSLNGELLHTEAVQIERTATLLT